MHSNDIVVASHLTAGKTVDENVSHNVPNTPTQVTPTGLPDTNKHLPTCCSRPRSRAWRVAWFHCSGPAWATASSGPVGNPAANQ